MIKHLSMQDNTSSTTTSWQSELCLWGTYHMYWGISMRYRPIIQYYLYYSEHGGPFIKNILMLSWCFSFSLLFMPFVWNHTDVFSLFSYSFPWPLWAQNCHHSLFKQGTIKNAMRDEVFTSGTMHWINTGERHMKVIKLPSSIINGTISGDGELLLWDGWIGERLIGEELLHDATLVGWFEDDCDDDSEDDGDVNPNVAAGDYRGTVLLMAREQGKHVFGHNWVFSNSFWMYFMLHL